jgi:hypothetical protein
MNLLKLFPKKSVTDLQKASSDAIGVFSKTINELNEINTQINTQKQEKVSEMEMLQKECNALETQEKFNSNIINKIQLIIN